jgi:hypothetical protein
VDVLAFCAVENSSNTNLDQASGTYHPLFVVPDPKKFADDTASALLEEDESGSNAVHKMLDAAMESAVENGSDAVKMSDEGKRWKAACAAWDSEKEIRKLEVKSRLKKRRRS